MESCYSASRCDGPQRDHAGPAPHVSPQSVRSVHGSHGSHHPTRHGAGTDIELVQLVSRDLLRHDAQIAELVTVVKGLQAQLSHALGGMPERGDEESPTANPHRRVGLRETAATSRGSPPDIAGVWSPPGGAPIPGPDRADSALPRHRSTDGAEQGAGLEIKKCAKTKLKKKAINEMKSETVMHEMQESMMDAYTKQQDAAPMSRLSRVVMKLGLQHDDWWREHNGLKDADHQPGNAISRLARTIITHPFFELICCFVLFAYAIITCATATYDPALSDSKVGAFFASLEPYFCAFFVFEVSVRMLDKQLAYFQSLWNCADVVLVVAGVVRLFLETGSFATARVLRVLRITRVLRSARIVGEMRELRLLAEGLAASVAGLVWISLFLVMFMMVCSTILVQGLRDDASVRLAGTMHPSGEREYEIGDFFGSLESGMFSLFQILTLESWCMVIVRPIAHHAYWTVYVFVAYILFTVVAVLNIVTGIFVEKTMAAAKYDDRTVLQDQMTQFNSQLNELRAIFEEADMDHSGELSDAEFQEMLTHPRVRAFFARINMDTHEVMALFRTIDQDLSGSTDIEEFLFGVMRVRSGMKAMDMIGLMHDVHKLGAMLVDLRRIVEQLLPNSPDRSKSVE